jgi:DNA repair exonuclease SbcCD ATPase subunit
MRVSIINFRKFASADYDFKPGTINLLKGTSGAGKTTIFEAIKWCLYGGTTKVYPKDQEGSAANQTSVTLFYDSGMVVKRTKPPELLTVWIPNGNNVSNGGNVTYNMLSGEGAESYIASLYGSKSVWESASYVQQKQFSPLMSLGNADKMDLLKELSFGPENAMLTESPEYYLSKIETEQKANMSLIQQTTGAYNVMFHGYKQREAMYRNRGNWQFYPSAENIEAIRAEILILEAESRELQSKILACKKLEGSHSTFKKSLETQEMKIANFKKAFIANSLIFDDKEGMKEREALSQRLIQFDQVREMRSGDERRKQSLHELQRKLCQRKSELLLLAQSNIQQRTTLQAQERDLLEKRRGLDTQKIERPAEELDAAFAKLDIRTVEAKITENTNRKAYHNHYRNICLHYSLEVSKAAVDAEIVRREANIAKILEQNLMIEESKKRKREIDMQTEATRKVTQRTIPQLETTLCTHQKELKELYPDRELSLDEMNVMRANLRSGTELKCPACSVKLELNQGTLVECKMELLSPFEVQRRANIINTVISTSMSLDLQRKQLALLEEKLKSLPVANEELLVKAIIPPNLIEVERQVITTLRSVAYILSEEELKEIDNFFSQAELRKRYGAYEAAISNQKALIATNEQFLSSIGTSLKSLSEREIAPALIKTNEDEITSCEQELSLLEENLKHKNLPVNDASRRVSEASEMVCKTRIAEIDSYNKTLELISNELETTRKALAELDISALSKSSEYSDRQAAIVKEIVMKKDKIVEGEELLALAAEKRNLDTYQSYIESINKYGSDLARTKIIVTETINHALQELVDNVNVTVSEIIRDLFEDEISITLSLFKENKSNDKVRAQVNLQIEYKGSSISGGEKDRISLALTLAMSRISSSPFIFLDELMLSLPIELRDACLHVIRKYHGDKIVVNICHETVEGTYDNVISL